MVKRKSTAEENDSDCEISENGTDLTTTIPLDAEDPELYEDDDDPHWDEWRDHNLGTSGTGELDPSSEIVDAETEKAVRESHSQALVFQLLTSNNVEWLHVELDSLTRKDVIMILLNSHTKFDLNPATSVPLYVPIAEDPTTVVCVLDKDHINDVGDATRDCFSPWSHVEGGKSRGTTAECRWYLFDDEFGVTTTFRNIREALKVEGKCVLWVNTQKLSRCNKLKRTVAAIYNLEVLQINRRRTHEGLASNVLVAYSWPGGIPPLPSLKRLSQVHVPKRSSLANVTLESIAGTSTGLTKKRRSPVKKRQICIDNIEQMTVQLPHFILEGRTGVVKDAFLLKVRRTKIYAHPDPTMENTFLAEDGEKELCYKICANDGDVLCGCMWSTSVPFCNHIVAYVLSLPEESRQTTWKLLNDKKKISIDEEHNSRLACVTAKEGRRTFLKRKGDVLSSSRLVKKINSP